MINCIAFDVEVFRNAFSITFINLNDYLEKCKCQDEDGNNIPLTDKYTVKEIKEILDSIECKQFLITDTNDDDLLPLAAYINDAKSKFIDVNGKKEACRTDYYGYNILSYDNLMVAAFLMWWQRCDSTKQLLNKLYDLSKEIIKIQNSDDDYYNNNTLRVFNEFKLPYGSVDIMRIFALNKAGVIIDNNTGERKPYPKSMKQTSINLKWYELLEFTLPPIDEEEQIHYSNEFTLGELNKLISPFDRYLMPKYEQSMLHYNKNDVFIVCEAVRQKIDEIRLRYSISNAYHVDVLSSARSNIADVLFTKFYSERSGLHPNEFKKGRTERTALSFKKIIFPHIQFKTKELQTFLDDIKKITIYRTTKSEFSREIEFYGTKYTIATGGIHSQDPPRVLKSTDKYVYVHHDYTSYYPSIIISYNLCPAHLNKKVFVGVIDYVKQTRVAAKHAKKGPDVITGVPNKITAEALKIVINSIYGKLGYEKGYLYDRFVQMQVTINGQLMTMTLIEELELNGIHCASANTDGIVIKLPLDKIDIYNDICKRWNEFNKMGADDEHYETIVSRDVNNYLDLQKDGTIEFKGDLDPKQYIKDLTKGYDMPVVAKAVSKYFLDNIPIMDSLKSETDILNFCKTQNVSRKFSLNYLYNRNHQEIITKIQRNSRFYVSNSGGVIYKEDNLDHSKNRLAAGNKVTILNTLDDTPISERDINYKYYYEECYKIINPILLGITPKGKGKTKIRKQSQMYNNLFDEDE